MSQTPPENPPENKDPDPTPKANKGSGQHAVFDVDLGQFVSGVSDKATADKARKALSSHNGAITDDHKLETREV